MTDAKSSTADAQRTEPHGSSEMVRAYLGPPLTAKPWPHGWRPQVRLLPVPDMKPKPWPALLVIGAEPGDYLYCVTAPYASEGTFGADPADPRTQPDIDDAGTKGVLIGLARAKHGPACQVSPIVSMTGKLTGWTWYLNDVDNHNGETRGGAYASEGLAHVGLLDHPATKEATNAPAS